MKTGTLADVSVLGAPQASVDDPVVRDELYSLPGDSDLALAVNQVILYIDAHFEAQAQVPRHLKDPRSDNFENTETKPWKS